MSYISTFITYDQASRDYTLVDIINAAIALLKHKLTAFPNTDVTKLYAALEDLKNNLKEYPPSFDRIYWMQRLQQIIPMVEDLHPSLLPVMIFVHRGPSDLEKLAIAAINEAAGADFVMYNLKTI